MEAQRQGLLHHLEHAKPNCFTIVPSGENKWSVQKIATTIATTVAPVEIAFKAPRSSTPSNLQWAQNATPMGQQAYVARNTERPCRDCTRDSSSARLSWGEQWGYNLPTAEIADAS
jgi:hypothetical protein